MINGQARVQMRTAACAHSFPVGKASRCGSVCILTTLLNRRYDHRTRSKVVKSHGESIDETCRSPSGGVGLLFFSPAGPRMWKEKDDVSRKCSQVISSFQFECEIEWCC